jgi:predicted ATPase
MNTTIVVWHPRTRAIALACFSILYLDIDFHPRLTAIVVTNGAGKTSALDAVVVVVALCTYVGAFGEGKGSGFVPGDIRQTTACPATGCWSG